MSERITKEATTMIGEVSRALSETLIEYISRQDPAAQVDHEAILIGIAEFAATAGCMLAGPDVEGRPAMIRSLCAAIITFAPGVVLPIPERTH